MRIVIVLLAAAALVWGGVVFGNPAHQKTSSTPTATQQAPAFRIFNPDTMAKPAAGYSHVAEVTDGKLVYIAGQVAIDRAGNPVGKDDFRAQVQQVFENLK